MRPNTSGTFAHLHARLNLYRALRRFAGPVLAHRIAFAWRA